MSTVDGDYFTPDRCPKCGGLASYIGVVRPDFNNRREAWCQLAHAWLVTVVPYEAVQHPEIDFGNLDTDHEGRPIMPENGQ